MAKSSLGHFLQHLRTIVEPPGARDQSDSELLQCFCARHDQAAFATLVQRHGPLVLAVCRRVLPHLEDAEDAFQATFLALARDAGSIRKRQSLASWLHGVAHHMALNARRAASRRRKHEQQATTMPVQNPEWEAAWREVQVLLDEEIQRLPAKYRELFILCCLENQSRTVVAARLGLKEGTVCSRLSEARRRLRQRLARRGVELSAVLGAAALTPGGVLAKVPSALAAAVTKAAVHVASGHALAGLISAPVQALVQAMPKAMVLSKAAWAVLLIAAAFAGGGGIVAFQRVAANAVETAQEKQASAAPAPQGQPDRADHIFKADASRTLRGRVLGPDGKPLAGTKLLLLGKGGKPVELGRSGEDGRFAVVVPPDAAGDDLLVAQTHGAGIDFANFRQLKPEEPAEFRLVRDQPIRGRVIDLQGKPVAGARVAVNNISIYGKESLEVFLTHWKKRRYPSPWLSGEWETQEKAAVLFATTTDAKGEFALRGIGAERLVSLRLSGAGVADMTIEVVNRPGFDPKPYNDASRDNIRKDLQPWRVGQRLHGPDVVMVAEPERIVRGMVCDAATGRGRPQVEVQLHVANNDVRPLSLRAKTDAQGRYEIRGGRKAASRLVSVESDLDERYPACQLEVLDTPGYQLITADIRLPRGVAVTGRMLDAATRQPLDGYIEAAVLPNNPFLKEYPIVTSRTGRVTKYPDGSFRLVTIPGPVLLIGTVRNLNEGIRYKSAGRFYHFDGGFIPLNGAQYCKLLRIEPGTETIRQDIVLEPEKPFLVKVQDADGQPLPEINVAGLRPEEREQFCATDECPVYGLTADKPRLLVFLNQRRKLTGSITVKGTEYQPVVVKLGPTVGAKVRLVGENGNPLPHMTVEVRYRSHGVQMLYDLAVWDKPQVVSDANGRVSLDRLIPDLPFELRIRQGQRYFERAVKPAPSFIQVNPGDVPDLGDIKLRRVEADGNGPF